MAKVRVASFAVSLDGYGAGPGQCLEHPLGMGGLALHDWSHATRTFQQRVLGSDSGETGPDDELIARGFENVGAWILGRNMFAPSRGPWPVEPEWNGWWGNDPPYHTHVFVLTHHPRPSVVMDGNTTFHFVCDGIHAALERALDAAGGKDVRVGGGVATIRQYLRERLIDEMHVAIAPVVLGSGEPLFTDLNLRSLGYECVMHQATPRATHVVLHRTPPS